MRRLVLFDIDETMISSHGCGRRALERAMSAVYAQEISLEGHTLSGKTDPQICKEALLAHGFGEDEITRRMPELLEGYLPFLEDEVRHSPEFKVHPGIIELLDILHTHDEAKLGLLTGNIEAGARTKLKPFNLNQYFSFGAYGSDSANRMELPAVAHRRALELFGKAFQAADMVIIGDARNDVLCAKGFGARSIAVATGKTPKTTLSELEPDYLFDDLSDVQNVLSAIFD